jgi:hypothetical protein
VWFKKKAVRLEELNSLNHLPELVSAQLVRIDNPGHGYQHVYLATKESMLLTSQETIYGILVKGEMNQAKNILEISQN